jgi:DNA-binding XRE family transcriptional regulator
MADKESGQEDNKDLEPDSEDTSLAFDQEDQGVPVASVHITDNETGEELGVVDLMGVGPDQPEEEIKQQGVAAFQRLKAAEESLEPQFIEGVSKTFPADVLLDMAAVELTRRVVPVYLEKLENIESAQELEAREGVKGLTISPAGVSGLDIDLILERQRSLLNDLPDLSIEFARFAWTHLIGWATDLMEEELGGEKIEAMTDQEFDAALHDFTFDKNPDPFEDRLKLLANVWANGLGRMLVDTVDPASRSLEELEILMGLRPELDQAIKVDAPLFEVAESVKTSNALIVESTRQAITKAGNWSENKNGAPWLTVHRKGWKPIKYSLDWPPQFEPSGKLDLAYARLEILGQVYTANLERALEAHALKHGPGETFYLDGDSLFKALGIPAHLKRSEKLKLVNEHARRVSCLRVNPITSIDFLPKRSGKGKGTPVPTVTTREGFVWNIIIEREYQRSLLPDAEPELSRVVLEVKPGDCWRFFLDKNNPLYFYRYTTAPQLNLYTDKLASMLEPYLEFQCGINKKRLPWAVKVGTLLEAALDGTSKRGGGYYNLAALRTGSGRDRGLVVNQWEDAILALMDLSWSLDFDPATYPEDLRPAWALEDQEEEAHREKRRKPKGYWDKLMAAKVLVSPPPGIAGKYPSPEKKRLPPASPITGAQVKAAREKAGLTQGQLAERLGISKSLMGMVEQGRRRSPELLERTSKELGL